MLTYLATALVGLATLLAAALVVTLYVRHTVPRSLAIADGAAGLLALVLHTISQVADRVDQDYLIAVPFLTLGVVAGVVIAVRTMRGEPLIPKLTLAHAAMLAIGFALVIQGALTRGDPAPQW